MNKVFFRLKKIIENNENVAGPKKSIVTFFSKGILSGILLLSSVYVAFAALPFLIGMHHATTHKDMNNSSVLGTTTTNTVDELGNVAFNIPAIFNASAEFKKSLTVDGTILFNNSPYALT